MGATPPIPEPLWGRIPTDVQAALAAAFERIERRVAELEQRIGRNSTNSSGPPSTDPPSLKRRPPAPASGKRRGGRPGHPRHARPPVPPEAVRQVIECKPPRCRWCGDALAGDDPEPLRHQVAEVPPVRPVVDEYRPHRLSGPRCRTATRAKLPPGVPAGAFGPRLRAVLSVLAGAYRLGKRPVQQLALDLLGRSISTGMTCRLGRRGAADLEAPAQGLREHVRTAASAHIDETSWWQGRGKMWLWAAMTKSATVFTIARSRGADIARGLLGTDAREVVVSDRSKGYGWIKRRRFCWAHLRRDFRARIDRGGEAGEVGRRLLDHSDALFRWWHRVRDGTLARSGFRL
jgi:transposase